MTLEEVLALPVHPAAEEFAMLSDEELDELAESIKANGLRNPIVIQDGMLVDGRNRREACRRAGVVPKVSELNGEDVTDYIFDQNITRRHLSSGQRAMATARLYPKREAGRGKFSRFRENLIPGETVKTFLNNISKARIVIDHSPALIPAVRAGHLTLDDAYRRAKDAKQQAESVDSRMSKITKAAPDLVPLITEERLSLEAAETEIKNREQQAVNLRRTLYQNYAEASDSLRFFATAENSVEKLLDAVRQHSDEFGQYRKGRTLLDDAPDIRRGCEAILSMLSELEANK